MTSTAVPTDSAGHSNEKLPDSSRGSVSVYPDIDLLSYHEEYAGRLIMDPAEARVELGEAVAARLKLTKDGKTVLWPQPTDDPEDPQNWTTRRKTIQLIIITLASIIPDFDSGIGIASIFALAKEYGTTPNNINNLTSNWSIFLLGPGGVIAVVFMRRYGRLPILFWTQLIALGFLIGCTFAPTLNTFAAMRCLTAFFGTAPQVTGLYIVTDMYPFHLQTRNLNIWTMGYIMSPFLSPFLFGFTVARTTWRWTYGAASMYGGLVVLLIMFFGEETLYDRTLKPIPARPTTGVRYRVETLLGVTAYKMAKYRDTWAQAIFAPINVFWRPHLLSILIYEGMFFGFAVGINVTNVVFLGTPKPVGFGFGQYTIAALYATPVVSVLIGELIGRYMNDYIMNRNIRNNNGVFEAESRLWATYLAMILYIIGFIIIGVSFQYHLHIVAIIFGWGLAVVATMINTVATYAYCNDSFPKHQGEVSGLLNFIRTCGGFSVAYFQIPWATKHGALQVFGVEAAIVAGLFLLIVPYIQRNGRDLRARFSL